MQALLKEVPDAANRFALENYWLDRWDAHRIRMMIDEAAAWGHENNVPLICNEFGAYRELHRSGIARELDSRCADGARSGRDRLGDVGLSRRVWGGDQAGRAAGAGGWLGGGGAGAEEQGLGTRD